MLSKEHLSIMMADDTKETKTFNESTCVTNLPARFGIATLEREQISGMVAKEWDFYLAFYNLHFIYTSDLVVASYYECNSLI